MERKHQGTVTFEERRCKTDRQRRGWGEERKKKKGKKEGGKKELSESEVSGGRIKTGFGNFH